MPEGHRPGAERTAYDLHHYRKALTAAGFENVSAYSIGRDVYSPLATYLSKRLRDRDLRRVNPVLHATFSRPSLLAWGPWADYIIAVATKP
ncbi:hypothetical protein [Nocardia sp. NBC_01388]|uniref:hypothetical protein n=1 Tax=Nocardia sp. NBC_01388 TaxID=2903596 RepID=UPI003249246B